MWFIAESTSTRGEISLAVVAVTKNLIVKTQIRLELVLETLYSGDIVLLIFPDGTGPGESIVMTAIG